MSAVAQSVGGDPPACIGMSGVSYPGLVLLGYACIGFALSDHAQLRLDGFHRCTLGLSTQHGGTQSVVVESVPKVPERNNTSVVSHVDRFLNPPL